MKRLTNKTLRFLPLLGLLLFAYVIWRVGLSNVIRAFYQINPYYLALTPFFIIAIILLKGLKWKLILKTCHISLPYNKACVFWAIGYSAGGITPGEIGETIRAIYLNRNTGKSFGECLSTVAIDKIIELIGLIILFVPSLIYIYIKLHIEVPAVLLIVIVLAVLIGLHVFTNYSVMKKVLRPFAKTLIPDHYKDNMKEHFDQFFGLIEKQKAKRKHWVPLVLLTIFTWLVLFLHLYTLALSLRMNISLYFMFMFLPTIIFVSILPVSISGIGTRDAASVLIFSLVGVPKDLAVAWSVLCIVAGLWSFVFIGWLLMLKYPLGKQNGRLVGNDLVK